MAAVSEVAAGMEIGSEEEEKVACVSLVRYDRAVAAPSGDSRVPCVAT